MLICWVNQRSTLDEFLMEIRGAPVVSVLSSTYSTHGAVKDHSTLQSTVNQYWLLQIYWSTLHCTVTLFHRTVLRYCCVVSALSSMYSTHSAGKDHCTLQSKVNQYIYRSTLHCTMTLLHRTVQRHCCVVSVLSPTYNTHGTVKDHSTLQSTAGVGDKLLPLRLTAVS